MTQNCKTCGSTVENSGEYCAKCDNYLNELGVEPFKHTHDIELVEENGEWEVTINRDEEEVSKKTYQTEKRARNAYEHLEHAREQIEE